ncbi:MAG: MFS transporter [Gammaproteobacteria bacterium]|nr:MFS transporter [Gammaproteobacteria bacterium]
MSRGNLKQLTPLLLLIFIDSFSYFLVLPVLLRLYMIGPGNTPILPMHDTLATRNFLFGISMSISMLAMIVFSPIVGHFSDIKGRKKTLFYCLLAAIVGFLIPIIGILYRSVALIIIGRFISGASSASQPIAQAAITDFSSGKQKAFYLSLIAFAMTLAMMLGPLAGGYLSDAHLVSWFNVMTPYWAGMGLAIINILLMLRLYHETHHTEKLTPHIPFQQKLQQLITALTQKKVWVLLVVFLLLEIAWSQYYQSIFLILTHHFYYTPSQIGLYTTYVGVWMCIGLTVIYKLLLRFLTIRATLTLSLIGSCIGLLGCNVTTSVIFQWLFVIPVSIFIGTGYTSLVAIISNQSDTQHQGWVLGTISTLLALAWLITGFFSGILVSISTLLPLIIAAASICAGLGLYFILENAVEHAPS